MSEFGAAQLAIQAAVSDAFKTPEVIRMSVAHRFCIVARPAFFGVSQPLTIPFPLCSGHCAGSLKSSLINCVCVWPLCSAT